MKSPTQTPTTIWLWVAGCLILGLLLLVFSCWVCLRLGLHKKTTGMNIWPSKPISSMVIKKPSLATNLASSTHVPLVKVYTEGSSSCSRAKMRRLRACKLASTIEAFLTTYSKIFKLESGFCSNLCLFPDEIKILDN